MRNGLPSAGGGGRQLPQQRKWQQRSGRCQDEGWAGQSLIPEVLGDRPGKMVGRLQRTECQVERSWSFSVTGGCQQGCDSTCKLRGEGNRIFLQRCRDGEVKARTGEPTGRMGQDSHGRYVEERARSREEAGCPRCRSCFEMTVMPLTEVRDKRQ